MAGLGWSATEKALAPEKCEELVLRHHLPRCGHCKAVDLASENKKGGAKLMKTHFSFYSSSSEDEDEDLVTEQTSEKEEYVEEWPSLRKNEASSSAVRLPRTTQVVFDFQSGKVIPRLREPRRLYGVTGPGPHSLSRWPQECEVIPEEIHHIEWAPPVPEPLCVPGNPKEVVQMAEEEGTLVYTADEASKEPCFSRSRAGGSRTPLKVAAVILSGPADTTLVFEARFESGNLLRAVKVGECDYELTLRTDLYTEKHTQWFYFRVSNTMAGVRYRFTITNLLKATSLYKKGQRPLLYSEKEAQKQRVGWHRIGEEVSYYRNGRQQSLHPCYSLSWTFLFPHDRDTCYFAHCYPYTYSNLRTYLSEIEQDPVRSQFCKIRMLCRSLAGNLVPVLTVTNPATREQEGVRKPAIVVTARIHPGETNSSWVMKGILDFLLGNSEDAALLRDTFVFKLVPMLNPDGVIVGNYRCSLTGRDLNRNYRSILRDFFPTLWATKNMIQRLCEERKVLLYCDLHGHSRKHNAFIYGCERTRFPEKQRHERIFPLMLSKNCPNMFSFQSCKFKVQRKKEGTGRVALWRMGVPNSFTLETSFCGSDMGDRKGTHFSISDLEALGFQFCDTLLDYYDPDRTKYMLCLRELQDMMKLEALLLVDMLNRHGESKISLSDHEGSISGSNSSDSDEPPAHLHDFASKLKPCKKYLKSKKERNKSSLFRFKDENLKRAAREPKKMENIREFLEKNESGFKPLIVTPAVPRRELSKWRNGQLKVSEHNSPNKKMSVLYLVFDSKRSVITSKSEYLQNLMAEFLCSRMLLGIKHSPTAHDLYTQAPQLPLFSPHGSSVLLPRVHSSQKEHTVKQRQLPAITGLAAGDKGADSSSPVSWRVPKSYTAPASVTGKLNRYFSCSHKRTVEGKWESERVHHHQKPSVQR
ncbi:cytosolic carboxypeptidase 2 isoform X3 [Lepisosteus oculatus]|uniref:cytosolic carboxypeptidase 2 isoform X3 n=1 Tax=Lepisosteus oculatus TaxID=7918 RepID=UPI0037142F44